MKQRRKKQTWLKAKSFLEAEISWQIFHTEGMSVETKGEGGKDL